MNYQPHCVSTDTEASGKLDVCEVIGGLEAANFTHLIPVQYGMVALSRRMIASLLSFLIERVIPACSKKKVQRIHAAHSVALVQHPQSVWNASVVNKPGRSVGVNPFGVPISNGHVSIICGSGFNRPHPARSQFWAVKWDWSLFINALPKAAFERFGVSLRKTGMLLKYHCRNHLTGYGHAPGCFYSAGALFKV